MKEPQAKIRSLTGVKNAVLKHRKVWLTMDGKTWVYAELKSDGCVLINYGLSSETVKMGDDSYGVGDEKVMLHKAMGNIFDFLSFKRSTDLLGG